MAGMQGGHAMPDTRSVADLTVGTDRPADKVVHLVARKETVRLASGAKVDGYSLNGASPGPLVEVTEGQLLEVHLRNVRLLQNVDDPGKFVQVIEYETPESIETNRQRVASDPRLQTYLQAWRAMLPGGVEMDVFKDVEP